MSETARIWTLAICLLAGCMGVEESGNDPPTAEDDSPATRLIGEWEFRYTDFEEKQRYVFGSDGRFQAISERASGTSIHEGVFNVIDSMAHIVLQEGGSPTDEIWLRFSIREDSMVMYKGVSLRGGSETLIGEWTAPSSIPDSAGNFPGYALDFSEDGLLVRQYPVYLDTTGYLADGSVIHVQNRSTGETEMKLGYEIIDGRLSIYNLETERWLYRLR